MILKKPYAFIIKHFRAIHLLMLIPMIYLIIETKSIVKFFQDYIANGYIVNFTSVLSNLASNYINIFMYLAVIIILVVFIAMAYVLQKKEKPTKFYSISIVYYLMIFILLTTSFSIFKMVETDTLENILARIVRDLCIIVHYSQYIFVIFTLIRGVGFNIKKFNFKSDIQELEISSEDSEEFEFLVGVDIYKTKRSIRRFFRELKYYYKENKFIFTIIFVLVLGVLATTIYMNREVNKVYKQNETIAFGYLNVKIKDSYISNLSLNGDIINEDKTYVILRVELYNRYREDKEFNYTNLELVVNKKRVAPKISVSNYFSDYGNPYNGTLIKGLTTQDYILVYEIDKYLMSGNFNLIAYSNYDSSPGGLGIVNKEISINPTIMNTEVIKNSVNKGTTINLEDTNLKATKASILDYQLTTRYEYKYKSCENCTELTDAIYIDYNKDNGKTLLVMDYKLELDETSTYMYSNKNYQNFFEDFMKIQYTIDGKEYYEKIEILNKNNYNKKIIMKVSNNINNASDINAIITVRNISYSIKLK